MGLGVALLRVNEVRELGGSRMKKTGVLLNTQSQLPSLRPELDRKATRVASGIRTTRLATNGRETDCCFSTIADFVEQSGTREVGDVMGHFEVTVSTSALSVHDTLGNALAIKVGKEIDVVEV